MSVAAPSGTATGDLVIVVVHGNGQTTIADNNGSTPFTEDLNDYKPNTGSGHTVSVFSRRIQAGDPSTYNFTLGASGRWSIIAVAIQNPNGSTVYDVAPSSGNAANNDSGANSFNAPSITTSTDNAIHFAVACSDDSIGSISGTPAGYTSQGTTTDQPLGVATKTITPVGATGAQTFTTGTTAAYIALSFAVKAAGGTSYSQTLSDSMTLTDTLIKQGKKVFSETVTHTDSVIKQTSKPFSETTSLTDTLATLKAQFKTLSDTLNLTDAISKVASKFLTETTTLTDTIVKTGGKVLTQTITLTDAFSRLLGKVFTETLSLLDTVQKLLNGLSTFYSNKFSSRGTSFSDKYSNRGSSYSDKYSGRSTTYNDKYPPLGL